MIATLEGGCRVSDMHDGEPVTKGTLHVWRQVGRATGADAISLRVLEFAPGISPTIRNGEADEILYVLDNSLAGQESDPEIDQNQLDESHMARPRGKELKIFVNSCSFEITPDAGVYIRPRETYAIKNPGPHPLTVISAQCPDPDQHLEFVDSFNPSDPQSQERQRIVRLADQRAQPTADRWYRVLVDAAMGSVQATQFVGSIPPGRAPDNFHHYEEVLFILKGEGRRWAGATNTPIAPGSCVYLPKGQAHCVENTGEGELRLLGVFYPAGSPSVRYEA